MTAPRVTTVADLRRTNRSRVLWTVFLDGPCTRAHLARRTGLSAAAVSTIVGDLLDHRIVTEVGSQDSQGGRPRSLLRVNPAHGHVVGVDVGETGVLAEVFDLGLTAHARHLVRTSGTELDPADAARHIADGIEAVVGHANVDPASVLGVGVGVPGVVEHAEDAVVHGQSIGWPTVPLGRMLRERITLPLLVDNGAKSLGRAEQWFGAARGASDAVVLLLGIGVGTCIVSDGSIYRGPTSSAGEWGHTTVRLDGRRCRCGASGCLEAYVGAGALVQRYDELLAAERTADPLEDRVADILSAGPDDEVAATVRAEWAGYLGAGIADLVNLFNPQRIVVGGWLGLTIDDALLQQVRDEAAARALHLPFSHARIVRAELGREAVALGAATLPLAAWLSGQPTGRAPVTGS